MDYSTSMAKSQGGAKDPKEVKKALKAEKKEKKAEGKQKKRSKTDKKEKKDKADSESANASAEKNRRQRRTNLQEQKKAEKKRRKNDEEHERSSAKKAKDDAKAAELKAKKEAELKDKKEKELKEKKEAELKEKKGEQQRPSALRRESDSSDPVKRRISFKAPDPGSNVVVYDPQNAPANFRTPSPARAFASPSSEISLDALQTLKQEAEAAGQNLEEFMDQKSRTLLDLKVEAHMKSLAEEAEAKAAKQDEDDEEEESKEEEEEKKVAGSSTESSESDSIAEDEDDSEDMSSEEAEKPEDEKEDESSEEGGDGEESHEEESEGDEVSDFENQIAMMMDENPEGKNEGKRNEAKIQDVVDTQKKQQDAKTSEFANANSVLEQTGFGRLGRERCCIQCKSFFSN